MGKWSQAQQRYYRSEAGKNARRKYQQSDKAKATRAAYYAKRKAQKLEKTAPVAKVKVEPKIKSEIVANQ